MLNSAGASSTSTPLRTCSNGRANPASIAGVEQQRSNSRQLAVAALAAVVALGWITAIVVSTPAEACSAAVGSIKTGDGLATPCNYVGAFSWWGAVAALTAGVMAVIKDRRIRLAVAALLALSLPIVLALVAAESGLALSAPSSSRSIEVNVPTPGSDGTQSDSTETRVWCSLPPTWRPSTARRNKGDITMKIRTGIDIACTSRNAWCPSLHGSDTAARRWGSSRPSSQQT